MKKEEIDKRMESDYKEMLEDIELNDAEKDYYGSIIEHSFKTGWVKAMIYTSKEWIDSLT